MRTLGLCKFGITINKALGWLYISVVRRRGLDLLRSSRFLKQKMNRLLESAIWQWEAWHMNGFWERQRQVEKIQRNHIAWWKIPARSRKERVPAKEANWIRRKRGAWSIWTRKSVKRPKIQLKHLFTTPQGRKADSHLYAGVLKVDLEVEDVNPASSSPEKYPYQLWRVVS